MVVVIVKIFDELLFEVFHRIKFLQIEQFTFEQAKEVFYYSIVQTITFPAHALPDTFLMKHPLLLFMLVLPALIGMKDQVGSIRYFLKGLFQHSRYHVQNGPVRERIADQIATVQVENRREMQKDFVISSFSSVTLDPSGNGDLMKLQDITQTVITTAAGETYVVDGFLDIGIKDTMKDLFVNMVGALVFSVLGYLYEKDHARKIPDLIIHRQKSDTTEKMPLQVGPDLEKVTGD